jgi:hypothetical protein
MDQAELLLNLGGRLGLDYWVYHWFSLVLRVRAIIFSQFLLLSCLLFFGGDYLIDDLLF